MKKRLFIFAGYDKDNIADATLTHYLNALSKLGDIVFTMDNDMAADELNKIKKIPNVLHAATVRHGEYDFGSYKRGYIWARDNKLLSKYEWIYLVNDSVIGPLWDISDMLKDLESRDADMIGLVMADNQYLAQSLQSWFVGITKKIATARFFDEFMTGITRQESKSHIVLKYEVRLTRMILSHGCKISAVYHDIMSGNTSSVYDNPKVILDAGIPFVKKTAIKHKTQIEYLLPYTTDEFVNSILNYAGRHNCPDQIPYQNIYSLRLFGLPIFSIKRRHTMWATTDYKIKLFDCMTILKISSVKK